MDRKTIDRPIFLIGCPRSGTTVIFEALSIHPEVAWFSHYLDTWPGCPWITILNRFTNFPFARTEIRKGRRLFPFIPEPSEAWQLWELCCGKKFVYGSASSSEPTSAEKKLVFNAVSNALAYHGKRRFIAKLTGPPRIRYLKKILPDAIFINIIRDGRAVVNSLLNVRFWQEGTAYYRPWWAGFPDDYYEKWLTAKRAPLALATLQWRHIAELTELESRELLPSDFLTVRYEDFTENPEGVTAGILHFCGLDYHRYVSMRLKHLKVASMNYKWKDNFSSEDLALMENLTGAVLQNHGYSLSSAAI